MKKKIVFVFFTVFVNFIVTGQNKKPVDALHHTKGATLVKGKQVSSAKAGGRDKTRRKDSLKAMNDPMTKLERPGHDSLKLSKPAPARQSYNERRNINKAKLNKQKRRTLNSKN